MTLKNVFNVFENLAAFSIEMRFMKIFNSFHQRGR